MWGWAGWEPGRGMGREDWETGSLGDFGAGGRDWVGGLGDIRSILRRIQNDSPSLRTSWLLGRWDPARIAGSLQGQPTQEPPQKMCALQSLLRA